jgi:hypothetical protein
LAGDCDRLALNVDHNVAVNGDGDEEVLCELLNQPSPLRVLDG